MDDLLNAAIEYKKEHGQVCAAILQRKHKITHERACQICEELENLGIDWVDTELMPLPLDETPFLAKWHDTPSLCQYDLTEKSYYLICYPADQQSVISITKEKSYKIKQWKKI